MYICEQLGVLGAVEMRGSTRWNGRMGNAAIEELWQQELGTLTGRNPT